MNLKIAQAVTDRIIKLLEEGTVPWRKPWETLAPVNGISRKGYQGMNFFSLHFAGYKSPYWLTFNQAKSLGGMVRKGEKGTPVIFWKTFEKDKGADTEKEKGGKPGLMLRYSTAFNVEQIDGLPEGKFVIGEHKHEPIAEADSIIANYPGKPEIQEIGDRACYIITEDKIRMPAKDKFKSTGEYYSTLFHELTHSTRHKSRLDRDGVVHDRDSYEYGEEELVAELGSAMLCASCGIDNTLDNSASYLAGWLKEIRENPAMLIKCSSKAQKAVNHILGIKPELLTPITNVQ